MLLTANGIKKSFGENVIFDNVSFGIDEHDKIGFVGSNGAGKSTLFKILIGQLSYDRGEMFKNKNLIIGYLDQYSCNDSEKTVLDETLLVFSHLIEMENQLEDIRYDIEANSENIDELIKKQNRLSEEYEKQGGFLYKNRARSTLIGLGFSENELRLSVKSLSGGQKTRVSLAKILLSDANLLLLDEPTNHLDIEAVCWLENFLKNYSKAFIVISHDRYFLDRVTNRTFELDSDKFYSMNKRYSEFVAQRDIEKLTEERNYENTIREIERLQKIVEQQRRWNREKNIKTAESKLKVINKLKENLIKPTVADDEANFRFRAKSGGGDNVLIAENLAKSFPDGDLFKNIGLHITKGERVFLVGPNGCGKTTLLKIFLEKDKATSGEFRVGANTYIGYYDQLQESLNMDKTILDEVWDEYPKLNQTSVRNALATFLFKGEEVFKEIKSLSGGERARVELVKLILKDVNFLILDEPTNHLDIKSREALERALSEYDGTLLMVSHDRYFINSIATRIIKIEKDKATSYPGNYDDYLEKTEKEKTKEKTKTISEGSLSYKEQKRIEAEKRKIRNSFIKTEEEIFSLETRMDELSQKLQSPEVSVDYEKAQKISDEIYNAEERLKKLYADWEELQQKMEEF